MALINTRDQLYHAHGEVDSAMPAPNTALPLVWIPELQAWLVDTSSLGGTPVTPSNTGEDFMWRGNKNEHQNVMVTNKTNAANQYEFSVNNSNCQQMALNNQTFDAYVSNDGSLLHTNTMNELNNYSSMWSMRRTYNEKVSDKENFYPNVGSSQFNLSNTCCHIPSSEYKRNVFEEAQLHGSGIIYDHVSRIEDMEEEFCDYQHEFGLPHLRKHMTTFYGDELFEATDLSSLGNQVGDNKYYTDNVHFLPQHGTQTSFSQFSWTEEQENGICNHIPDYILKMNKLPSVEDFEEKLGYVISIDGQQEVYLPGSEELGEELGFVKTANEYGTRIFTTNLVEKQVNKR